jgi:hypothetical protein
MTTKIYSSTGETLENGTMLKNSTKREERGCNTEHLVAIDWEAIAQGLK